MGGSENLGQELRPPVRVVVFDCQGLKQAAPKRTKNADACRIMVANLTPLGLRVRLQTLETLVALDQPECAQCTFAGT